MDDMDMMDMMDMGGMDMGSEGTFEVTNSSLARSYWYIIAGIVGFAVVMRVINYVETQLRLRRVKSRALPYPTKPRSHFMQAVATASAIFREISAPEYVIKNRWLSWLSPPPLGRSLIILIYWAVIIYMLCWGSVVNDAYYFERIGFRAAWTSVTQVPFMYLLASKSSILGFLTGSSYERLNWLHRWVSRTLLVTVTIHGGFFYAEWYRADFVEFELQVMPMVKYGMGAWAILLWTFLSSLAPIRRLSYEIFVLQHLAAAGVLLWLLWVHVPVYAQYNIWFAVAAVSFDKILIYSWTAWINFRLRTKKSAPPTKRIGFNAVINSIDDKTTEVVVPNVPLTWKAGQHVYLRIPSLGPIEAHPFTIANSSTKNPEVKVQDLQLIIESKSGFTGRLHRRAAKSGYQKVTAFVTGPFGRPPTWTSFETLVLISASTGASFTLPVLESVVTETGSSCVRRIDFLMIFRQRKHSKYYVPRLLAAIDAAGRSGIDLNIRIAITCDTCGCCGPDCRCIDGRSTPTQAERSPLSVDEAMEIKPVEAEAASMSDSLDKEQKEEEFVEKVIERQLSTESEERASLVEEPRILYTSGRPQVEAFIRRPVEATGGETSVAVCGGKSLVACVRNCVASLSDERGVHKGTGAQGIHLHTEHYCI